MHFELKWNVRFFYYLSAIFVDKKFPRDWDLFLQSVLQACMATTVGTPVSVRMGRPVMERLGTVPVVQVRLLEEIDKCIFYEDYWY